MAEYIDTEGDFPNGSARAADWGHAKNEKKTPYLRIICTDEDSGGVSEKDLWCSQAALDKGPTIPTLKALGCKGKTNREILTKAIEIDGAPCSFSTAYDKGGYIKADEIWARGGKKPGGRSRDNVPADDWLNSVFGTSESTAETPSAKEPEEEDNVPF